MTDPHVFVAIDPDGTVTLVAHRAEMGTGSRTSLPMIMADEMEADWSRVRIVQAPGDEPKYGNQDTDGSRSLRHHIQPARDIGAAVRHMLEQAAAAQWGVPMDEVEAINHEVVHKSLGTRLGYGALAQAAMDLPTPPRAELRHKDEKAFRYTGKGEVQITDLHDITTGAAVYGADVSLPGMKYAVIARPPVVDGRVKSYDAKATLKVRGVERVEELAGSTMPAKFAPKGGIAVIADSTWAAIKGRDALVVAWDNGHNGSYDTADYHKQQSAAAAAGGNVANALGLSPDDVTINVTLLGGGFGRKSKCDFAIEAALLSQKIGAPVRVQWTRDDDIRDGFFHTTSVERIEIGLDADNKPVAWRHRSAAPSFLALFAPDEGYMHPIEVGMGLADMPYDIPNVRCEDCEAKAHARVGWYRSVSNVPRAFAVQSITAELAHELGRDQKDFLLEMIGEPRVFDRFAAGVNADFWNYGEPYDAFPNDTGRLRHVVELVAEKAGWGKSLPKGEALGIAVHRSFVSYVAAVVHVKVDADGTVRVPETHVAIDCGYVANPERVRSQIQGACVFGMTAAMYSGITFENGAVVESNFHDYPMVRADNFPETVYTHIVPHPFAVHATGVGEPGVPPVLPALTNAIFNATGKRIRDLPVGDQLRA